MQEPELTADEYIVPEKRERLEPFVPPPSPNNPPWNTPLSIAFWFVSVLLIVILPSLFVLPYAVSHKIDLSNSPKFMEFLMSDPTAVLLNIGAVIPAHLITIALGWAIITNLGKYPFRQTLGWNSGGMRWWHYAAILVAFFVIAGVLGNYFPETENDLTRILKSSRKAVYLVAFLATFTAPIVEEVIYRGVVYSAVQRTVGVGFGIAAATLLFALVHVPQYYPSYSTIFLLTLLSLILTLVRSRTGNLLPCIILHFIFNGLQSLLLVLEPFLPKSLPDTTEVPSLIWHLF